MRIAIRHTAICTQLLLPALIVALSVSNSWSQQPAQSEPEDQSQRAVLALEVRSLVAQLQAVRAEQRRANLQHRDELEQIGRQIEVLDRDAQALDEQLTSQRKEIAELNNKIAEQTTALEESRTWIGRTAELIHPLAEQALERIKHDAGEQHGQRLADMQQVVRLLADADPLRQAAGVRDYLQAMGDQWLPARNVTLANEPVLVDQGNRQAHA